MYRKLVLAALVVAVVAVPVEAKRVARPFSPVEKVARAELVVSGSVSAVQKDPVMLVQYAGDPNKVAHTVATIKIEKGLLGTGKLTEVKVAFVAPPKPDPNVPVRPGRGGFQPVNLTPGQEGVFFLTKHPGGDYYTVTPMMQPLNAKDPEYKAQLEVATKAAAAIADPVKALKAAKPEDRFLAATTLLTKFRTVPDGVETEIVKVPTDETRLILKALLEGDWAKYDPNTVNGSQAFYSLALTAKDGWVQPVVVNTPGAPPVDFNAVMKDAFGKWIDGPGKNYQISKIAPKQK